MKKCRRIEVNAFRRRVTIVSGEWPGNVSQVPPEEDDEVSINESASPEPVAPESPEGQLILAEAVRSLELRLSPETLATIRNVSESTPSDPDEFNLPNKRTQDHEKSN